MPAIDTNTNIPCSDRVNDLEIMSSSTRKTLANAESKTIAKTKALLPSSFFAFFSDGSHRLVK